MCKKILARYPGSFITAQDSFEAERTLSYRASETLKGERTEAERLRGLNLMLESIGAKEKRSGPGKNLLVALPPDT
jgi:hypothetical protein